MTNILKSSEVYLDANFLVAYLLGSHADAKKAQKLFAKMLIAKTTMVFSALSIDEMLNGIYKTLEAQKRVNGKFPRKPHREYIIELKQATSILLTNSSFRFTQFSNNQSIACSRAVENIDLFNLKPRDAFHLSYTQDQGIKYIVSNDVNFDSISSVKRIGF